MCIAKYPNDEAEKLRRELLSMEKSKRSSRSGYLHNVVRESQRFIPVSAFASFRVMGRDFSCKEDSMRAAKRERCITVGNMLKIKFYLTILWTTHL